MKTLLSELQKFSTKYEFNFQFWGGGANNVFIYKDDVEIYNSGDNDTVEEAIINALEFCYRVNKAPLTLVDTDQPDPIVALLKEYIYAKKTETIKEFVDWYNEKHTDAQPHSHKYIPNSEIGKFNQR